MDAGGSLINKVSSYRIFIFTIGACTIGGVLFFFSYIHSKPFHSQSNLFLHAATPKSYSKDLVIYGYLPYWTRNSATFSPTLTHVSYFSLGIQADGSILEVPKEKRDGGYRAFENGVLQKIRTTLSASQKLELTLSLMDQEAIPQLLSSENSQQRFLADLKKIVQTSPITGINLDIEYNGIVDVALQQNLTQLVRRSRLVLTEESPGSTLSIATYADSGSLQRITNLKSIASEVDYVIMMAYDYHRSKSPRAGPNSPIYGKSQNRWGDDIMHNLYQYTQSVPPEKIILGVPFYGYAWSIEDSSNPNGFTLPKSGESVPYANIQKILQWPGVRQFWDEDALSPYLIYTASGESKVLYYDNARSLALKALLVRQAGLGGIAVWAVGYETGFPELWSSFLP